MHFEFAVNKLGSYLTLLDHINPLLLVEQMLELFNDFLRAIIDVVTHPRLVRIPFPAKEFAGPIKLSWNTAERFSFLKNGITSYMFQKTLFQTDEGLMQYVRTLVGSRTRIPDHLDFAHQPAQSVFTLSSAIFSSIIDELELNQQPFLKEDLMTVSERFAKDSREKVGHWIKSNPQQVASPVKQPHKYFVLIIEKQSAIKVLK